MARNLTNTQLNIISESIMSELRKKKITNQVFKNTCDKVAEDINYKELLKKAKRYEEIQKQIAELSKEANMLSVEIKHPFGQVYFTPNVDTFLKQYNKKVEEEINKLLPTKFQIESDIVLASISGSKNLITEILKKYE